MQILIKERIDNIAQQIEFVHADAYGQNKADQFEALHYLQDKIEQELEKIIIAIGIEEDTK